MRFNCPSLKRTAPPLCAIMIGVFVATFVSFSLFSFGKKSIRDLNPNFRNISLIFSKFGSFFFKLSKSISTGEFLSTVVSLM